MFLNDGWPIVAICLSKRKSNQTKIKLNRMMKSNVRYTTFVHDVTLTHDTQKHDSE
jgi:hypothetical protein